MQFLTQGAIANGVAYVNINVTHHLNLAQPKWNLQKNSIFVLNALAVICEL